MRTNYFIILVTAKDKKQAQSIARALLEAKLIACANIIDGIQSLFWWQGRIDSSKEVVLVLKTKKSLFNKVSSMVKSLHSYQPQEIIAYPSWRVVKIILNGSMPHADNLFDLAFMCFAIDRFG